MSRAERLAALAEIIADYREGEIPRPDAGHVDRWVSQFPKDVQDPLLEELTHVFRKTYYSAARVRKFLEGLVKENKLAGTDPCAFWATATFLDIQCGGQSQKAMLRSFDEVLNSTCRLRVAECGKAGGLFIYLDDVLFSGSRAGNDLEPWIRNHAPPVATVHVVNIAIHNLGDFQVTKRLKALAAECGKKIEFRFWREYCVENRLWYRNESEVLWPAVVPPDQIVTDYLAGDHRFPFQARSVGPKVYGPFSTEAGRQLLESQFLLSGLAIRGFCVNPSEVMRPLGFGPFGVGFGTLISTYRNCPNNAPLALWWGGPTAAKGHPFSKWYPLLPRKTYQQQGVGLDEILF